MTKVAPTPRIQSLINEYKVLVTNNGGVPPSRIPDKFLVMMELLRPTGELRHSPICLTNGQAAVGLCDVCDYESVLEGQAKKEQYPTLHAGHQDVPRASDKDLLTMLGNMMANIEAGGANTNLTNAITIGSDIRCHLLKPRPEILELRKLHNWFGDYETAPPPVDGCLKIMDQMRADQLRWAEYNVASMKTATQINALFKERDTSKPDTEQGLFRKFEIRRVDGSDQPGGKHYGCRYFVLDMEHDVHTPAALRAYAKSCKATHPQLAEDLNAEFDPASLTALGRVVQDQYHFEIWAKKEGIHLEKATDMACNDGRFPATYADPATETAWRAWANKPQ